MSLHVEDHLGHLPTNWHLLTLRDLEALEAEQVPEPGRAASGNGRRPAPDGTLHTLRARLRRALSTRSVETSVVLRAVAIVLIVGTHAHVFRLQGTAHALLVLVGWIVLLVWHCQPSAPGANRFGPDPFGREVVRPMAPAGDLSAMASPLPQVPRRAEEPPPVPPAPGDRPGQ